jgi:hypothetical protein
VARLEVVPSRLVEWGVKIKNASEMRGLPKAKSGSLATLGMTGWVDGLGGRFFAEMAERLRDGAGPGRPTFLLRVVGKWIADWALVLEVRHDARQRYAAPSTGDKWISKADQDDSGVWKAVGECACGFVEVVGGCYVGGLVVCFGVQRYAYPGEFFDDVVERALGMFYEMVDEGDAGGFVTDSVLRRIEEINSVQSLPVEKHRCVQELPFFD